MNGAFIENSIPIEDMIQRDGFPASYKEHLHATVPPSLIVVSRFNFGHCSALRLGQ
jgi:hypothetical protein